MLVGGDQRRPATPDGQLGDGGVHAHVVERDRRVGREAQERGGNRRNRPARADYQRGFTLSELAREVLEGRQQSLSELRPRFSATASFPGVDPLPERPIEDLLELVALRTSSPA